MSGLRICLFIAFLAIVDVEAGRRGAFVSFDDENQLGSIPGDWDVEDPSIVTAIYVDNVNVDKINTGAFKNFTNLKELKLTGRIAAIEDEAFAGLDKLELIRLNGAGIQHIGPKVFYNLNSFKWLHMKRNKIKEIHLTNLKMLTEVNLSNNNITELSDDTFVNLENLESIDLSENKIRVVKNGSFDDCPNLTELYLYNNHLADIEPDAFKDLHKLKKLTLRNNYLKTITSNDFKELTSLKQLDLSRNKFTSLDPFLLNNLTELTHIWFVNNSITSLPERFFNNTPKLIQMNFEFNLLKEFHLYDNLVHLTDLFLGINQIKSFKLSTAVQNNISFINLDDNNLTHLDESFQHLINLEQLSLSNNKLKSFSLCIPGSLTKLDLSHNQLQGIALDKFCGSVTQGKLRRVDLSYNQFTSYNLTYTNKSLQETQPNLNEIDLSFNFLNSKLPRIGLLKIGPQRKDDVNINLNESMNGEGNTTWIVVTSAALAVGVFAVIGAIFFVCKERRRTNPNPNVNDAVMLNELYDDVGPARADDDDRSSPFYHYPIFPIYDSLGRPHIYHYPTFRPWYDEVRPQPVYLSVLPDIPGPQQSEQQDNGLEENIYEEID